MNKLTLKDYIQQYAPVAKQMWDAAQAKEQKNNLFLLVPALITLEEELMQYIIDNYSEKEILEEFEVVDKEFGYIFSYQLEDIEDPLSYIVATILMKRLHTNNFN